MIRSRRSLYPSHPLSAALLALLVCIGPLRPAFAQAPVNPVDSSQAPVVLQTTSNLVVVRVVVRDGKDNPVEGLKKEDFKLFDRGKEQTISQFEEHSSNSSSTVPGQAIQSALPESFLVLYFDDLYTSVGDLMQARAAADKYLASQLQPNDRVAIFTSTGMLLDFTSDPRQMHDALLKLRTSPRALTKVGDCPQLSDYQASEIDRSAQFDPTNDAWKVAMNDAYQCSQNTAAPEVVVEASVRAVARRLEDQAQILARTNLDGLDQSVAAISKMPGRRTVIMVSPGFLSDSEQSRLNRTIDYALRSQVVISSLDPKGLAVDMREADASKRNFGPADVGGAARSVDKTGQMLDSATLQEVAQGTGGQFFHNSNSLVAGFAALSGSSGSYTLAFAPTDLKQDGQFHPIKVSLAVEHKGFSVQARKGYFAAGNQPDIEAPQSDGAGASNPQGAAAPSPADDPAMHEQIREALFAKTDLAQLAVALDVKPAESQADTRSLSVTAHLDGNGFPFRNDGGTSVNTVIFVFGIFDQKGNLLNVQQKHDDLFVPEGQMPSFLQAGVSEDATFQLKPGNYRLRAVVIDAEKHRIASFSRNVKLP